MRGRLRPSLSLAPSSSVAGRAGRTSEAAPATSCGQRDAQAKCSGNARGNASAGTYWLTSVGRGLGVVWHGVRCRIQLEGRVHHGAILGVSIVAADLRTGRVPNQRVRAPIGRDRGHDRACSRLRRMARPASDFCFALYKDVKIACASICRTLRPGQRRRTANEVAAG